MAFAARRAKELGADAIIVLAEGQEYAGALSTGNTYTTGFVYRGGFNATTTGTSFAGALYRGRAKGVPIHRILKLAVEQRPRFRGPVKRG